MPRPLSKIIQEQEFHPGALGIFTNPFFIMRSGLRRAIGTLAPELNGDLLDAGCGNRPYEKLFTNATKYTAMDYDTPAMRARGKADVFYDGKKFPFADSAFDCVLSTEVLEHVFNPDEFVGELARVLKTGGKLLLTCPFVWDEHEQPHDYARYSSFGLRSLLERHGFSVDRQLKTGNAILALAQLKACYANRILSVRNYKIRTLLRIIFISPITIIGSIAGSIMPLNKDLYLGNVILATKK